MFGVFFDGLGSGVIKEQVGIIEDCCVFVCMCFCMIDKDDELLAPRFDCRCVTVFLLCRVFSKDTLCVMEDSKDVIAIVTLYLCRFVSLSLSLSLLCIMDECKDKDDQLPAARCDRLSSFPDPVINGSWECLIKNIGDN